MSVSDTTHVRHQTRLIRRVFMLHGSHIKQTGNDSFTCTRVFMQNWDTLEEKKENTKELNINKRSKLKGV